MYIILNNDLATKRKSSEKQGQRKARAKQGRKGKEKRGQGKERRSRAGKGKGREG